ncbi:hypothetical protein TBC1_112366, partial [Lentimicrobium saccharophilum]
AGDDATICESSTYTLSTATATDYTSLLWTSSGTGTFDDATILAATYTPSAADITAGSVTLTLTAQSAAPCVEASDDMVLTISLQATADAGVDATICEGSTYTLSTAVATNAASVTWSSNGTGSFDNVNLVNATYTPSAADIINGSVILTMTVTSVSPCVGDVDQMTLTINPQAIVSAGTDATICESSTYTLSTATATDYTSLLWTSSGTGTFDDATILAATYTPSAADIAAGSVTLTLTAQSAAPCVEASDDMVLTISLQATADAGVDATICEGSTYTLSTAVATNAATILWSTSGTGTFSNTTAENPVYTPSQNDIDDGSVILTMTVTSAAPCAGDIDQMTLTINPQAIVSAGDDATICESSTYTLSTATATDYTSLLWTSSGTGTFDDATILAATYTPSAADIAAGSVTLTLTAQSAAPCVEASDDMVLTISLQATADAGPDATICEGSTYTLSTAVATNAATILWSTSGTGSFSSTSVQNPVYTPSQNDIDDGSVILTMTVTSAGPCAGDIDQMTLTINPQAIVSAGDDATICEGSTYTLTAATATDYTSLLWTSSGTGTFDDATILAATYIPSAADIAAGSVTLTLTAQSAAPCVEASDDMVLTISLQATADAGVDATICEGSTYTLSTAVATNAATILWSTSGTGTFSNTTAENPVYTPSQNDIDDGSVILTMTVTSAAPCAGDIDQMTLTINPQAIVSAGDDATICESSTYTLTTATATDYTSLLWSTSGTGTFDDATILAATYTPSGADIAAGNVTLTLTAQSAAPCVEASDDMVLTISLQATADAGVDATICEGSAYTLSTASATNATLVTWSSNGTGSFDDVSLVNATYTPSAADILNGTVTLTLTVTSAIGCVDATDFMVLTINPQAIVSAGDDATICESSTYTLSNATATDYTSLLWTSSGTGTFDDASILAATYTPSAADIAAGNVTLTLTAQSAAPCVEASDDMVLTISLQATADAGPDATICEGSTYTLSTAVATNAATILWSTSGTGSFSSTTVQNPVYTPSQNDIDDGSVILTMTVTSAAPCAGDIDQMTLTINPQAIVSAGDDATICESSTYTLSTATATDYTSLLWTSSGTGTFDDATILAAIYTPSAADIAAGSVTLTLTAQSAAPCVEASDAMVLTISLQATADAGVDATICEGSAYTLSTASATNATLVTWSSNGTGSFDNVNLVNATYTPSAADILNGSVILTMTVTSAAPCAGDIDQMTLTINPQAIVSAGDDATICESSTYTLSTATATDYTSLLWTSSGTGTFDDATILAAIYTPSAADIAAGSVTLTLTAQSAAPCVEASDAMVLTISLQATADAGVDATICEGSAYTLSTASATNATLVTWSSNGTGSFDNVNLVNATYTPSAADILNGSVILTMTVTSAAPCAGDIDQMTLTINPQAIVSAGDDATICEGSTYTLTTATATDYTSLIWTSSGTGTFDDATILAATYTPSAADIAAGSVTLTLTAQSAAPCVEASDDMVLTISLQATADAGTDATICEGSTYTLSTASATNATLVTWSSNGTGSFDDVSLVNATYTPSAADVLNGSVILTMTVTSSAPCAGDIDQMTLTINPQAVVSAGTDATICESSTYTLTTATATDYTSLLWTSSGTGTFDDATILAATYTPSAADIAAGSVTLTLTAQSAAPCVEASDDMVLTISLQATADAGTDATICEGSTFTLSTASATNATLVTWSSNGTGSFDNVNLVNATYTPSAADVINGSVILTMTVTSAAPCAGDIDQMTLTINPQAIVSAGDDATICESSTYTLTTATATDYTSLLWTSSGTGTFDDATILAAIYTPSAADIAAGSVTLTLTAQSAAPCVEASDDMVLTISLQATADAGTDATICEGSTYTLSTASATNAASVTWSSNGTGSFDDVNLVNATYTPSVADVLNGSVILTMTVTSAAPCAGDIDQMTLTINPQAIVSAGDDATICESSTYTLTTATATDYTSLLWTSSGTGTFDDATILAATYTPSAADIAAGSVTLTLTAQSAAPCVEASDDMVLTISLQATADAGTDATICEGSSYTLSTASATNATLVTWSSNGTGSFDNVNLVNATYTPSAADILNGSVILTMTVTSASPCVGDVDQMTLTINPQAIVSAGDDATICESSTYTLITATATDYTSLLWTSSGTGTFDDATILAATYTPSAADIAAGSVTLTLTAQSAAPCVEASDDMVLTISLQATADAGVDATICEGSAYTLSTASATNATLVTWSSNGTGSFDNVNLVNATYTPSAADIINGSVILTMTVTSAAPCAGDIDQMTLTINPQAIVSAGDDATICESSTYTLTTATATDYTSLLWTSNGTGTFDDATLLAATYTPSAADIAAGSVTLTLTAQSAAPCVEASDDMVLTISLQATADAGVDA